MRRREEYLESMLTDLGSAYYQTLHEEASEAGVAKTTRPENPDRPGGQEASRGGGAASASPSVPRRGKWRVSDVMTREVHSIDKNLGYRQVARLLVERKLSAVPVLSGGGRVLGVVSEADVLRKHERSFRRLSAGLPRRTHREREQAEALTAAGLMSSPAITIHPDAPLGAAARLMNGHHITRLPVVSPAGDLVGIVSRRDLMSVFLRPDSELATEIADAVAEMAGRGAVAVTVSDGEVTLAGSQPTAELISQAVRAALEVDGVVTVHSALTVDPSAE
jgi:CBS-domain-containing membrane protein